MTRIPPICPYCKTPAVVADSARVYNGRSFGPIWLCANYPACDAYVGCHRDTEEPLGRLANPKLRAAKSRAHRVFDPLWRDAYLDYDDLPGERNRAERKRRKAAIRRITSRARTRAYAWLAHQLGIPEHECHIGYFDLDLCEQTVSLCQGMTPERIREWAKAHETTTR